MDKAPEPDICHNHGSQRGHEANPLLGVGQNMIVGLEDQCESIVSESKPDQEHGDTCDLQVENASKSVKGKAEKDLREANDADCAKNGAESSSGLGQKKCAKGRGCGLKGAKQAGADSPSTEGL